MLISIIDRYFPTTLKCVGQGNEWLFINKPWKMIVVVFHGCVRDVATYV